MSEQDSVGKGQVDIHDDTVPLLMTLHGAKLQHLLRYTTLQSTRLPPTPTRLKL